MGPSYTIQKIPERDYSGNTDRIIAENAGVSHDTVNKVEKIIQLAPPEMIKKLETKTPKTTINSVFNELRNVKKREAAEIVGFPTNKQYDVIYCDPYFRSVSNPTGWGHKEIVVAPEELPIKSAVMGEGILFIWTPTFFLDHTLDLAKKWGFVFRDIISWELNEEVENQHKPIRQNQIVLMICSSGASFFWNFQEKPLNLMRHNLSHEGNHR